MTAEKISDSVGKKIVEALKMQNQGTPVAENTTEFDFNDGFSFDNESVAQETTETNVDEFVAPSFGNEQIISSHAQSTQTLDSGISSQSSIDSAFTQSLNQNLGPMSFSNPQSNMEYPANVAVLNSLIAKLPTGVSRQTGALIIRQTMEALGISMQAVIQEAKQVQDDLSSRARECQKNIVDYRKQISMLEMQAQQYQRQAVTMNDIIGLFVNSK